MNCLAQSAHNFKIVFPIDRTTLWQVFMMHQVIAIEENSEQNLHIWYRQQLMFRFFFHLLNRSKTLYFQFIVSPVLGKGKVQRALQWLSYDYGFHSSTSINV